jgi:hypothetical protein
MGEQSNGLRKASRDSVVHFDLECSPHAIAASMMTEA